MTDGNVTIHTVSWHEGQSLLAPIRYSVFVQEQNVSEDEEWDAADSTAVHFVAVQKDTEQVVPVGCARLLPDGKIGRMAVLAEYRNQGVGTALLKQALVFARDHRYNVLFLDAQTHALTFYERLGFTAEGPEFLDAGIPHRRMRLATPEKESDVIRLQGGTECLEGLRSILSDGRHSIEILTEQLEPGLYAVPDVVEQVSALARRSSRSRVRILVKDTRPLRSCNHALVQLAQRLPSRVDVRGLRELPQNPNMGYCVVDRRRLVFFNQESELTGFSNSDARAEAQHLMDEFNHLWEHYSFSDPNLKKLYL